MSGALATLYGKRIDSLHGLTQIGNPSAKTILTLQKCRVTCPTDKHTTLTATKLRHVQWLIRTANKKARDEGGTTNEHLAALADISLSEANCVIEIMIQAVEDYKK